jgi:ParB-like chromosome segregation protein Spo0J
MTTRKKKSTARPSIKLQQVKTADLIPFAGNSREHSDAQISQIAASIREFGFLAPIIADDDNTIIAGHGRVLAAQLLELDKVPVIRAAHLTPAQMRAYVIADNKLSDNSQFQFDTLKLEFEQLRDLDFDLTLTGFNEKELDKMFGGPVFDDAPDEFPEDDGGDNTHVCPSCGYEWR